MYIHNLNPIILIWYLSLKWYSLAICWCNIWMVVWKKIISFINNKHKNDYNLDLFDDFMLM